MKVRIANLESEQFSIKNSFKILKDTFEQNSWVVTRCMELLDRLNEKVNTLEKVPNKSSYTESSHTIQNKENYSTNQKQDKPVLMNQLKDWQ